ncbi:MAG: ABC transporter substrate-binding protein, partial [Pseudomonadota bacterium]
DANVATDYAMENGMGGIDEARFARAIEQIKETYEFQNDPTPELYFDASFLPPSEARMLK